MVTGRRSERGLVVSLSVMTCWCIALVMALVVLYAFAGLTKPGHAQMQRASLPALARIIIDPSASVVSIRSGLRDLTVPPAADGEAASDQAGALPSGRWLIASLSSPSTEALSRVLVLQSPTLAGSGIFGAGAPGIAVKAAVQWVDGETARPLDWVDTRAGAAAYQVTLDPDRPTTVALLVSDRAAPYSVAIWEPATFRRLDRLIAAAKGVVIGVLMTLIALAAGRWVLHGNQEDLTTTAFVGGGFVFVAAGFGVQYGLLAPDHAVAGGARALALALFSASGLYLLHEKLALERIHPDLPRGVSITALVALGLGVLGLPGGIFAGLTGVLALVTALFAATAVVMLARARQTAAIALMPGMALIAFCGLAATLLATTVPGPLADLQAMMLSGAVAAGVSLCAVSMLLPRSAAEAATAGGMDGEEVPVSAGQVPLQAGSAGIEVESLSAGSGRGDLALEAADHGVWDWDVAADRLTVSPKVEAMLGLRTGGLGKTLKTFSQRIHPDDSDMVASAFGAHTRRGNQSFDLEFRLLHEDQSYRWVALRGSALPGKDGQARRVIGVLADITGRKFVELRLIEDTFRDGLTGLANRGVLLDRLARLLDAREADDPVPALMVIDLDRFKTINEGLGHGEGDAMLTAVARRLEGLAASDDTVARIGGDEFAILLADGVGEEGAWAAGHMVAEVLGAPLTLGDQEVLPSVSIGVAVCRDDDRTASGLLRHAEIALYRAKAKGSGEIVEYTPKLRGRGPDRVKLEHALQKAVDRGEIEVRYQPVIDLRQSRLAGFEALSRWRHAERGLISTEQFIAMAEDTGAIIDIGRFVLDEAVTQLCEWHARWPMDPPLFVSVNVSSRQLLGPEFVDDVRSAIGQSGLPPRSVRLEITESLAMANPELAAQILRSLRDDGVGLSVDDFGTGFSSLGYLMNFPFDTLKIDRSFIAASERNESAQTLIGAMTRLGHDLGMSVVGEGPERDEDVQMLHDLGCDYAQGHACGAPMTAAKATALLTHTLGPGRDDTDPDETEIPESLGAS